MAMPDRILVAFYSGTGNTRKVAEAVASRLGAELDEISAEGRASKNPGDYSLVIVGTPVNGFQAAEPTQAYLKANQGRFRKAAFFATYALWTAGTLGGMEKLSGCKACASETFKTPMGGDKGIRMDEAEPRIAAFADRLRKA